MSTYTFNAPFNVPTIFWLTGASNEVRIGRGDSSNYIKSPFNTTANWQYASDERIKKDIVNNSLGLSFINKLRTVNYKRLHESEYPEEIRRDGYNEVDERSDEEKNKILYGLVAQEVKSVIDEVEATDFSGWGGVNQDGIQSIGESAFVIPLIKAVQELSAKVTALENA